MTFSGSLGLVIRPDKATATEAIRLASQLAPHATVQTNDPHVTLYHAQLRDLQSEVVQALVDRLNRFLGVELTIDRFQIYGGKFLFWNIHPTGQMRDMHEIALALSEYVDSTVLAKAIEEGLDLQPRELEYVRQYGYPLARELFIPHITLAYDSSGLTLHNKTEWTAPWRMKIDRIALAEIGEFGRLKKIIDLV